MEILEAFDLTGSFSDAGPLAGRSHCTVAFWVARRDAGALPDDGPPRRAEELAGRQASSIDSRRKASGFPTDNTFDAWDETISSIPAPTQRALRTLEWVERHENVVVCGPSGTGKSHFLEALGHAAIDHGAHVSWFSLEQLGHIVRRGRADDSTGPAIKRIMRADVIVIVDIGLLPVAAETAEALYRVVDAANEKRSIALSSNLHPVASTDSCARPSPTPPSTGSRTTPTSCSPPRQRPRHPSHRRQGGEATEPLTCRAEPLTTTGQFCWPRPGSSTVRHRADPTDR
jgi:DNA replication protein DnaC